MSTNTIPHLVAFDSEIGWIGVCWQKQIVLLVQMGYSSQNAIERKFAMSSVRANADERRVVKSLQRFLAGRETLLLDIRIDRSWMTPFQCRVTDACRRIPWGKTLSYGRLAELTGSPRASRAVGSVMATNRFPLIVPCHRVVSRQGVGGFSAPDGVNLKRRLLANESALIGTN